MNTIICADALDGLKVLEDESVDMCVTSPPYYGLRDYGTERQIGMEESPQEYVKNLTEIFMEVYRVLIRNMTLKHTGGFAIQIGRCENFCLENIKFEDCFADGVHINGFVKNGLVKDISGHTEDDLVALNMYDWENSTITNGPLENV